MPATNTEIAEFLASTPIVAGRFISLVPQILMLVATMPTFIIRQRSRIIRHRSYALNAMAAVFIIIAQAISVALLFVIAPSSRPPTDMLRVLIGIKYLLYVIYFPAYHAVLLRHSFLLQGANTRRQNLYKLAIRRQRFARGERVETIEFADVDKLHAKIRRESFLASDVALWIYYFIQAFPLVVVIIYLNVTMLDVDNAMLQASDNFSRAISYMWLFEIATVCILVFFVVTRPLSDGFGITLQFTSIVMLTVVATIISSLLSMMEQSVIVVALSEVMFDIVTPVCFYIDFVFPIFKLSKADQDELSATEELRAIEIELCRERIAITRSKENLAQVRDHRDGGGGGGNADGGALSIPHAAKRDSCSMIPIKSQHLSQFESPWNGVLNSEERREAFIKFLAMQFQLEYLNLYEETEQYFYLLDGSYITLALKIAKGIAHQFSEYGEAQHVIIPESIRKAILESDERDIKKQRKSFEDLYAFLGQRLDRLLTRFLQTADGMRVVSVADLTTTEL